MKRKIRRKLDKIKTWQKLKISFVIKSDDRRCLTRMTALYRDDSPSNLIENVVISMSRAVTRHWRRSVCVQEQRQPRKSGSACVTHAWDATQGSRGANARTPTILSAVHTAFTQRPKYTLSRLGRDKYWRTVTTLQTWMQIRTLRRGGQEDFDFMDLFIYVVLREWGKLLFIDEGLKFWNTKNRVPWSSGKIYFPNKIWLFQNLIRQIILRKVIDR